MLIEMRAVPPFSKNGFVVACERTKEAVLIDPGDEVDELLQIVAGRTLSVNAILLTHAHIDHVSGVLRAKEAVGAPVYLHRDDKILYDAVPQQALMFGLPAPPLPPRIDRFYDTTPLTFGDLEVRVHHTPGHCPGGVCLQIGPAGMPGRALFVGDTLFAGSIGRTDFPGGDYDTLMNSIRNVLFPLGDDCTVYPGHGPATTIGHERSTNPFLKF
jgi:glyoxylase-like metal-dependent hydrolase (beta-lactamase superfamily II)